MVYGVQGPLFSRLNFVYRRIFSFYVVSGNQVVDKVLKLRPIAYVGTNTLSKENE